jgi:hypothetical protein
MQQDLARRLPASRPVGFSDLPTISSAISRAPMVSRGSQVATFLPRRRIVAVSQSARISSSLCEI